MLTPVSGNASQIGESQLHLSVVDDTYNTSPGYMDEFFGPCQAIPRDPSYKQEAGWPQHGHGYHFGVVGMFDF